MKKLPHSPLRFLLVLLLSLTVRAVTPIYINSSVELTAPQIDATAFVNRGTFQVSGLIVPYTTQDTLNYTNSGSMASSGGTSGGFDLEYISASTGIRQWASTIVNQAVGSINVGYAPYDGPYLILKATNIINHGTLSISSSGLIHIEGSKVDLSNGIVEVQSTADTGVPSYSASIPYGEATNTAGVDPLTLLTPVGQNLFRATSPAWTLQDRNGRVYNVSPIQLFNPLSYVVTNQVDTNRQIIEVVFVEPQADTNVLVNVSFAHHGFSPRAKTNFSDIFIQYSTSDTNIVTGAPDLQQVVLIDELGAVGSATFFPGTVQPTTTFVQSAGSGSLPTNSVLYPDLFTTYYDTNFPKGLTLTNVVTTNFFTAIELDLASSGATIPNIPGVSVTNLPGRVEIGAKSLDLTKARIRGQGVVNVRAESLVTSKSTIIQAPYVYYDLGATNGDISVANLAGLNTLRFANGAIDHLSILFTNLNSADIVSTNTARNGDTNTPPMVTNTIVFEADYHVVFVQGQLTSTQPTYLSGLTVRGSNASIGDQLNPQDEFLILSSSLTLNTNLTLGNDGFSSGSYWAWSGTNSPNLQNFTNYGTLTAILGANFGADTAAPYKSWVNYGTIASLGIVVDSSYLEVDGTLNSALPLQGATAAITLTAGDLKVDGGLIQSSSDLQINTGSLKLRKASLVTSGTAFLNITGAVSDAGLVSQSRISPSQGISLPLKPTSGDLLGTSIEATSLPQSSYAIYWAAEDRGLSPGGYTNNVAIGRLYLQVGDGSVITFDGPGASNALYVDQIVLDPSLVTNGLSSLVFADNFTLYFADANVPVEQIDGGANGHLRWVGEYAGPNSGVKVALKTGQVIYVNRNLLNSSTVDSNGDGIVNSLDPAPFDIPPVTVTVSASPKVASTLKWSGAASTVYGIDYTSSLKPVNWTHLGSVTNSASVPTVLIFQDTGANGGSTRYYRVTYQP